MSEGYEGDIKPKGPTYTEDYHVNDSHIGENVTLEDIRIKIFPGTDRIRLEEFPEEDSDLKEYVLTCLSEKDKELATEIIHGRYDEIYGVLGKLSKRTIPNF